MRQKKSITLANKPTYQGYSYAFKVAIIERIENGQLSANQAAKEYDVSRSAIQKWIKKYGNLDKKLLTMNGKSPKQQIEELKKKLREEQNKNQIWGAAMDIIETEYGVDVKKKFLSKYQREVLRKLNSKKQ